VKWGDLGNGNQLEIKECRELIARVVGWCLGRGVAIFLVDKKLAS
jgi:hypothetical protein